VLELAIARALYERFPSFSEGRLAKIRSHVVSRASCAEIALELDLGARMLREASGTPDGEAARLATNRNVLAALLEAALAAVYLEHGFDAVSEAVVAAFEPRIEYALHNHVDHKTELQERIARTGQSVSYQVIEVEGPPHDRRFTVAALLEGAEAGVGKGRSKKDAEQEAAKEALLRIETAPS
jgi:ribonuclease-3